jgi:diguanylate cyclase (GGDEF)-like protein
MPRVLPSPRHRRLLLLALVAVAVVAILQVQPPGLQLLALGLLLALALALLDQERRHQQLEASAHALSLRDPLTALPNRRHFLEQVELESTRARRSGRPLAVLFLDIDQFRSLNDTYGHSTGDRVLIAVAQRLRHTLRLGDGLARYGDDEFAVLMDLSGINGDDEELLKAHAYQFASRLVAQFRPALELGDTRLDVGVSVGVSVVRPDALGGTDAALILRQLDGAILQAKAQRHERVAVFDLNAGNAASLDDYQLFSDLKEAIRQGALHMAFQPLVNGHGQWCSLEALARWQHPSRGFIPPDRFIAVAERYRLMRELGDQIFRLSLQGFNSIREALQLPELRLSANISPSQLSDPELHRRLDAMLHQAGIAPQLITLEITEASILERNPATEANLEQFRRQGYRLSLDDFGTGYSSLSLLGTLRPHEIKIDKSFVMALGSDGLAGQIVAVVAGIARQMDLELVAEGVENAEVLEALQAQGIGLFQGYLFQRPQPAEALIASATGCT